MNYFNIVTLFIITFSFSLNAGELAKPLPKKETRWNNLYRLVELEIRAIKAQKSKHSTILYRLLELNSEKMKLIKEKENEIFLKTSPIIIRKNGKPHYYKKSKNLEFRTRKLGNTILKKYPSFKFKGRIYYTLGLNSMEYGDDQYTRPYLYKALQALPKNSPIRHNVRTVLAENYYNDKKYDLANKFYSFVIRKKTDRWYGKHLYNSSWCLFKTGKIDESIKRIKESYFISNNPKYVNITAQILNSMAIIYSKQGKIDEGIVFFLSNIKKGLPYLFKMVDYLSGHGELIGARKILVESEKHFNNLNSGYDLLQIQEKRMEIFKKFTKYEDFLKAAFEVKALWLKYKFNNEKMATAVKQIKDHTGYLQVLLFGKKKRELLPSILSFLDILSDIDFSNIVNYQYFKGETYFGIESYTKSMKSYISSLKLLKTKKIKDLKLSKKVLNALLANLEKLKGRKNYVKFALFSYVNFIKIFPNDPKSKYIYSNLFKLYLDEKRIKRSIITFNLFLKEFPKEVPALKKQLMSILEFYINKKNGKELAYWVRKMEKGLLNLDPNFINKTIIVLGNILFYELDKKAKENKQELALIGLEKIYNDERYPLKIKGEASLKAGVMLIKKGMAEKSSEWILKSLQIFPKDEIFKKRKEYASIIHNLAYIQDFSTPNKISLNILTNFCTKSFQEKESFFKTLVSHTLIDSNPKSAIQYHRKFKKCIKDKKLIIMEKEKIYTHLLKFNNALLLSSLEKDLSKKVINEFSLTLLNSLYLKALRDKKSNFTNKIQTLIETNMSLISRFKNSYQLIANIKKQAPIKETIKRNLILSKNRKKFDLKFSDKKFSSFLETNLGQLKNITEKSEQIKAISNTPDHFELNNSLIVNYESFSYYLSTLFFKNISKADNMVIKKVTKKINFELLNVVKKLKQENQKILDDYNLSHRMAKVTPFKGYYDDLNWIYPSSRLSITIDLKGEMK